MWYYLLLAVLLVPAVTDGKKILLVPTRAPTHMIELMAMSSGLNRHGHDVYMVVPQCNLRINGPNIDGWLNITLRPISSFMAISGRMMIMMR